MQMNLDYEPRRYHRRKRRFFILLLLCIVTVAAGKHFAPVVWRRVRIAYWRRECAVYCPPPGRVVYEDGMKKPSVTWEDGTVVGGPSPNVSTDNPEPHTTMVHCWEAFDALRNGGLNSRSNVLFLHRRTDAKGRQWIVAIFLVGRTTNTIDTQEVAFRIGDDGPSVYDWNSSTHMVNPEEYFTRYGSDVGSTKLTIYAERVDTKDASRVAIPFKLGELLRGTSITCSAMTMGPPR